MDVLCETGAELKARTKEAGKRMLDKSVKGGAKVKLCREFDRRRTEFRAHIGQPA